MEPSTARSHDASGAADKTGPAHAGKEAAARLPRSRRATESLPARAAFYSVPDTARILGMSAMTLYRAIADGQFPAVRIRGRLIVPARVIEALAEASLADGRMVDAADWVRES